MYCHYICMSSHYSLGIFAKDMHFVGHWLRHIFSLLLLNCYCYYISIFPFFPGNYLREGVKRGLSYLEIDGYNLAPIQTHKNQSNGGDFSVYGLGDILPFIECPLIALSDYRHAMLKKVILYKKRRGKLHTCHALSVIAELQCL